ncbi:MAG: tetratricopeptide repeat protein, partial [Salinivirgaceae bacterium]|nr:tetratricopeptide repeat protein [Salinivirgaceae bacterium]
LSDYDEAISYLNKFDSDDIMVNTMATGAIGDAYAELGEFDKAISYYEKAANSNVNDFTTPIFLNKAAQLLEDQGKYNKAITLYEKLKNDYSKSQEGRSAEKQIARAKSKI